MIAGFLTFFYVLRRNLVFIAYFVISMIILKNCRLIIIGRLVSDLELDLLLENDAFISLTGDVTLNFVVEVVVIRLRVMIVYF